MVKVSGGFSARLGRISGPGKTNRIGQALFVSGDLVAAEASRSITTGSSGGQKGGKHQHVPSRPGEAPNEEFGGLRGGIEVVQVEPLKVVVSSNAPYSAPLEFGTSKMAARPFMGPAIQAKKDEVIDLVARAVAESMK